MYAVKDKDGNEIFNFDKPDKAFDFVRGAAEDLEYQEEFELYLTEVYGDIDVCGYSYNAGYILYNIDYDTYHQAYYKYKEEVLDEALEDLKKNVKRLKHGESAVYSPTLDTITYFEDAEEVELEL